VKKVDENPHTNLHQRANVTIMKSTHDNKNDGIVEE